MAAQAAMSSSRIAIASSRTASGPVLEARERPVHAPGEVDGGRPGGAQGAGIGPDPVGVGGLATPPGEERDAHRARHAERRRAADREPRDRVDERRRRS